MPIYGTTDTPVLDFTSGVTPLLVYIASIAAIHFPHMRESAEVGYWTGLECQTSHSEVRRADHSATATRLFPWELIEQITPWKILFYWPIRVPASFRHHTCR